MKTIKVMGQSDETLKDVDFGTRLKNFSVSSAVQFASDRSAANYYEIKDLQDDDIVELIFEDDIHRWVTVAELEDQFKYQISRGAEAGVIEIPGRLPSGDTSRGATSWVLTGLRVLKFDPIEKSAEAFAKAWDKKLMPKPGLYRFSEKLDQRGELNPKMDTTKPVLLFIHGTFSSTENGFKSLQSDIWNKLKEKYGQQIYGFDHRTLSESPIQNALELVKKLPKGVKLDLVTHSRGGLIGELLCRSGRVESQTLFDQDDENMMAEDKTALSELSRLLQEKGVQVERFVRVASPTRGTTLASKRFDRYLEIILNVIAKVLPPGPGNIFGVLADLLLDFKKQSVNPEAMPGLAAMDPESNFIKMINRTDVKIDADLTVIAGDIEKNNLVGRLAIFFTDLFFFDEHDLVVQTPAMYGGPTRKEGRYFLDQGSNVNHFHYFSNPKTAKKIREALISEPKELPVQGFRPIQEAYVKAVPDVELTSRSYQKRSSIPQPVVYILPGIMGTHLSEGSNRIWLDLLDLSLGKMVDLQISNPNVQPQALVALAYADLVEYLSATHEVIPFPYDWRLSILDEANRLAGTIEAKLKETEQPIRIIAHSMGGLVARAMLGLRPDLWDDMRKREGARFIMLGTPNGGSYQIPRLILGQEKTLRMLAMLDIKNSARDLLEVIARFPGVLGLLPMDEEPWNFLEASTWDTFPNAGGRSWVKPLQEDLDQAKELRNLLNTEKGMIGAEDPIVYVAGYAQGTPVAVDFDKTNNNEVIFRATNQGDGKVPWVSGILPELKDGRTYYLNAPHGDLAKRKDTFPAIYDLLAKGSTDRLPQIPPSYARGQEENYVLRDEGVEIYPTQLDLETTALGAASVKYEAPQGKPIRVSVAHGNLSFCSDPVAVGHYEGDGLYSAERALNHHLNGRLNARHVLGLYPGPEGTVEVVLNDKGEKPGGAVIVGLGKAGDLSPHKLAQAFAMALREYGIKAVENGRVGDDREITISTLLIGTGGMGLTVTNSVDAILNGVLQANKGFTQLVDVKQEKEYLDYNVRIAEVRFIELFKDQAILAARALQPFLDKEEFAVNPLLQTMRGGWNRVAYDEPAGWWNRIYIRASQDDTLTFSVPTDRARAEESRLGVQRNNMDSLIAQSVRDPNWDENLATAMFELMIPNRLKGSFKDMNDVLFVVDEQAASYPWELLYDRRMGGDKPIIVQVGMIRQFITGAFREKVVDVKNKNVLVVGNPANTPKGFADLPGAEQEAILVASKFKENSYEVRESIHADSSAIMVDLFSKDYRVLHLAGHGVYKYRYQASPEDEPREVTGMVLGNGVFLTANEIQNKMNIPELVFINCCHLGVLSDPNEKDETLKSEFNKFAASLSRELIDMGVKAVVAAGWAVDDAAAMSFAEIFYDHLLRGYQFGDAIKAARAEIYEQHGDRTNTWAAYQCYGDPAYRLVVKTDGEQRWKERFVDADEAIEKIDQLYERAKTASALGIKNLKDELTSLQKGIEENNRAWLAEPRLLEALGQAFAEVYLFKEAVDFYDQAINSSKSSASIKAIEQSANCHIRLTVEKFEHDHSLYTESKKEIEDHIEALIKLMTALGETPERLSMAGSGYKRLALISSSQPPNVCNQALEQMEEYYRQAWALTKKRAKDNQPVDPYPLGNALVAHIALLLRLGDEEKIVKERSKLKKETEETKRLAEVLAVAKPESFWAAVGRADVKLLDNLMKYLSPRKKPLSDDMYKELVEDYGRAWKQYGSTRELNSVIEHYAFLVAVLKDCAPQDKVCGVLQKIHNALHSMFEAVD